MSFLYTITKKEGGYGYLEDVLSTTNFHEFEQMLKDLGFRFTFKYANEMEFFDMGWSDTWQMGNDKYRYDIVMSQE